MKPKLTQIFYIVQKVIKIHNEFHEIRHSQNSVCGQCHYGSTDFECPRNEVSGGLLCFEYDVDGEYHYFVKMEDQSLVEDFKEAAGIKTEKTYTRQQVWDAYFDCSRDSAAATRFCDHIEKMSDPEYQEYLRLSKKFGN